jgi:UDP-N-acetylglucosamine 3-dehydrogenase
VEEVNMSVLKVGVLGVGNMGKNHVRVCKDLNGIELSGVHDTNPEVRSFAASNSLNFFENPDELIRQSDALIVALPTDLHYNWSMRCLELGKNVLVEKPITGQISQAEGLVKKAKNSENILQVGHVERFNPAVLKLKEIIEREEIEIFEAKRMGPFIKRDSMSGVIIDLMIHDIDVLRFLTGKEPVVKFATKKTIKEYSNANEDYAVSVMKFGSQTALFEANRVCQAKIRKINAFSHDKYIETDYISQEISVFEKNSVKAQNPLVSKAESLKNELSNFVASCLGEEKQLCTAEDALKTLRVVFEVMRKSGENELGE